jgi:hypothetical protein
MVCRALRPSSREASAALSSAASTSCLLRLLLRRGACGSAFRLKHSLPLLLVRERDGILVQCVVGANDPRLRGARALQLDSDTIAAARSLPLIACLWSAGTLRGERLVNGLRTCLTQRQREKRKPDRQRCKRYRQRPG